MDVRPYASFLKQDRHHDDDQIHWILWLTQCSFLRIYHQGLFADPENLRETFEWCVTSHRPRISVLNGKCVSPGGDSQDINLILRQFVEAVAEVAPVVPFFSPSVTSQSPLDQENNLRQYEDDFFSSDEGHLFFDRLKSVLERQTREVQERLQKRVDSFPSSWFEYK